MQTKKRLFRLHSNKAWMPQSLQLYRIRKGQQLDLYSLHQHRLETIKQALSKWLPHHQQPRHHQEKTRRVACKHKLTKPKNSKMNSKQLQRKGSNNQRLDYLELTLRLKLLHKLARPRPNQIRLQLRARRPNRKLFHNKQVKNQDQLPHQKLKKEDSTSKKKLRNKQAKKLKKFTNNKSLQAINSQQLQILHRLRISNPLQHKKLQKFLPKTPKPQKYEKNEKRNN